MSWSSSVLAVESSDLTENYATRPQIIGIALAISGNLIISFALALTKYAHNLNQEQNEPLPYTHLPLWWCGLAATVVGEAGNFAAYGFAGASLIAPLGAVSVLANAFISALYILTIETTTISASSRSLASQRKRPRDWAV